MHDGYAKAELAKRFHMPASGASFERLIRDYQAAIVAICDIAEAHYRLGNLNAGLGALQAGLLLLDHAPEKQIRAETVTKVLLQQGKLLVEKGLFANSDYEAALATLQRAHDLATSAGNEADRATALQLIGQTYYLKILHASERLLNPGEERYNQSLANFQQALSQREALEDWRGVSESLFFIGLIHERWGQFDTAQDYYTKALAIADEHGYPSQKPEPLRHLGGLARYGGDLEKALAFFTESLALWEAADNRIYLPSAHLAVGDTFLAKKDLKQAAAHYQAAFAISQEMDTPFNDIFVSLALGRLHQQQEDLPQARSYFEQAHAAAKASSIQLGLSAASRALEELAKLEKHLEG